MAMLLSERLAALAQLGALLQGPNEYLEAVMHRTEHHNSWFTKAHQREAVLAIATEFLAPERLHVWLEAYPMLAGTAAPKTIGLVMAGNIPLVGFHDVLCVFVAGHRARIKLSDKDAYLLPYLVKCLEEIDPRTAPYFSFVERLADFDAVIATGSNNSSRYFEAYFGAYPHIIRRNRNAVAVLTGQETPQELYALGRDVFQYFGLGCRNVAKLYLPRGYSFNPLLEALHEYRDIVRHTKYKNNFDYNYALLILNRVPYQANGNILLTENKAIQSHIAGLFYEYYDTLAEVEAELQVRADEIQCIVAREGALSLPTLPLGQAQQPGLADYADGVDTLAFLCGL